MGKFNRKELNMGTDAFYRWISIITAIWVIMFRQLFLESTNRIEINLLKVVPAILLGLPGLVSIKRREMPDMKFTKIIYTGRAAFFQGLIWIIFFWGVAIIAITLIIVGKR